MILVFKFDFVVKVTKINLLKKHDLSWNSKNGKKLSFNWNDFTWSSYVITTYYYKTTLISISYPSNVKKKFIWIYLKFHENRVYDEANKNVFWILTVLYFMDGFVKLGKDSKVIIAIFFLQMICSTKLKRINQPKQLQFSININKN